MLTACVFVFCLSVFGAVGSDVGRINEVALRRAQLVLGWVTVSGFNSSAGNLSQSNQPPRSTQPGHPSVGRRSEYRTKGGDALRLGVKAYMVLFAGNTVWFVSEPVRGVCVDALYKSTYTLLYFTLLNGRVLLSALCLLLFDTSQIAFLGCGTHTRISRTVLSIAGQLVTIVQLYQQMSCLTN